MITTFVIGFALVAVSALIDRKPRTCTECGQELPGRRIVKHYEAVHVTADRTRP